jgi:ABC-2 type transport system permease protein
MIRTVLALMKKEFHQVLRDRTMLRLIFVAPLLQLLILGYTASTDVKLIYTALYDFNRSELSREFVRSFSAGDYFVPRTTDIPVFDAERGFKENKFNAVMVIPKDFSNNITRGNPVKVGFMVDGTNANSAAVALGYANVIASQFNQRVYNITSPVAMQAKILYNPEAKSVYYMVPGIVATLLIVTTVMLTCMAIVREREIGTLEQLMVTPISTPALLLGKIIPFALIGFLEMSIALAFGIIWFGIPFVGSWLLLYALAFIFVFTTLGVGIFISTITKTQQQAMFFSWFFALFTMLTSGFFTPIANMPRSIQYLTYVNPLRYFMKIVRSIMMKGASIDVLYPEVLALIVFGLIIFSFSWMQFSKRVK